MNTILKHSLKLISVSIILIVYSGQIFAQQERPLPVAYPPGTQVSFVRMWSATAPEQDPNLLMAKPLKDVKQITDYLDGLGRKLQTVVKQGSLQTGGTSTDFVNPVEYDEFDRETYKYLPFAANNTGGNTSINDGAFKLNPFQQQPVFMAAQYGTQNEAFFYGKTNYEASPLNKVTSIYAPGINWMGSEANSEAQRRNKQVKSFTNTLTDAVRIWSVTNSTSFDQFGTYASAGNSIYPEGQLVKTITIDEHKKQVIEFKDKEGKVILKKVQLTALPDDGSGANYDNWLCTYYIYDDLGNLRCVIQPEGIKVLNAPQNNWTLNTTILNEQCFRYEYDQRNRIIMKKVPGAGEVYMVYDNLDRLVMTQDANMRVGANRWMVTKYDEFSRPTETGLWENNALFINHLSAAASSISYPTTSSGYEQLTLTHYDDYLGLPVGLSSTYLPTWNGYFTATSNTQWPYPQMPIQSLAVKGLLTWKRIKVLGSSNSYLYTCTIYDEKGKPIQVQNINFTGGLDVATTQYNWTGQPLVIVQKHENASAPNPQTTLTVTANTYDDLGRLLKIGKRMSNSLVNNGVMPSAFKTIVQNEYDQLGQLKTKKIGTSPNNTANPLESMTYDYNIRGWMLGANRDYAKDANNSNYFGFDLGYDKIDNGIVGNQSYSAPQYNGNIEGMVWKSKGDGEKRKYDFAYDAANRLLRGDFTQYTGGSFNQTAGVNYDVIMGDDGNPASNNAYDANGNILRMQQWGLKVNASSKIDNLMYNYQPGSNKLAKVTDNGTSIADNGKLGDFKDGSITNDDYSYDVNGNLTIDNNKSILAITYNHLNLPSVITVQAPASWINGSRSIIYTYDAAGNKLKKEVFESMGPNVNRRITTTYLNGFVYEAKQTNVGGSPEADDHTDALQFLPHEEGRIRFKPISGNIAASLQYDYMLKDHLGNVRMVLTEEQQQDNYPAATMETAQAANEELFYSNLPATRTSLPPGYPTDNTTNPNDKVAKTNGNGNKIGPSIILKVMAGDKFNVKVSSWYKTNGASPGTPVNPLADLVSALINGVSNVTASGTHGVTSTELQSSGAFTPGATSFLNNQSSGSNSSKPMAYLNWILFDEQFKLVSSSSGFEQVGNNEEFKPHVKNDLEIDKSGYLYIYVSNNTPNIDVFFDNLQVTHLKGQILEEAHYYPFGLTMKGISSIASGIQKNNEKTFQNQRFDEDLGLNWIQFKWRNHDPQIGRFIEIDPLSEKYDYNSTYAFSENKVTSHVELEGLEAEWATTVWQATLQQAAANGPIVGKVILIGGAVVTVGAIIGDLGREVIKIGDAAELKARATLESKVYSTTIFGTSLALNNYTLFSKVADASKNERHGDGGRAKTKSERQIEELTQQLKEATGRLKKQIEQKIKNIRRDAAQKAKGEEHSRVGKK